MAVAPLRIAIVGAGPAGLTLAALLHKHSLPSTVFELRQKPTEAEFDQPVGSLDLHEGTGLAAIRELGLFEEFKALTDDCSEDMLVANKAGTVVYRHSGDVNASEPRPEISRNKLNQLLLTKIPPSSIHWQHKLLSATRDASGDGAEVELDFGDKGKRRFDLVVGADGAWSKIRPLLTDAKPQYANQQNITTNIRKITSRYPHLAKLVGTGSFMCCGDKHGVVSQRATQDTARIYTMLSTPDEDFAGTLGISGKAPSEVKAILFEGDDAPLKNFGPVVRELIDAAYDDETAANPGAAVDIRPLYTLYSTPEGSRWEHKSGATLIGDAAHVMPPNGEGVNIAMRDALEVSKAIVSAYDQAKSGSPAQSELDSLIKDYEDDMFSRAEEVAKETEQLLNTVYGSNDGAEAMVEMMKGFERMATEAAKA